MAPRPSPQPRQARKPPAPIPFSEVRVYTPGIAQPLFAGTEAEARAFALETSAKNRAHRYELRGAPTHVMTAANKRIINEGGRYERSHACYLAGTEVPVA